MTESADLREIRGVLLPLDSGNLLMPNATVSEVIGYREPETGDPAAESWLLGLIEWRGQKVPLVSLEGLVGDSPQAIGAQARIAVCNTLNGNPRLPFIAVVLTAVPHLTRIRSDLLEVLEGKDEGGGVVAARVKINDVEAWIPDLDRLEQRVQDALA